jgi:hypothetical protein
MLRAAGAGTPHSSGRLGRPGRTGLVQESYLPAENQATAGAELERHLSS